MQAATVVILGHQRLEARYSDWGFWELLVNGRSREKTWRPFSSDVSFHLTESDAQGVEHAVEVLLVHGTFSVEMRVNIDGLNVETVKLSSKQQRALVCRHCLYSLQGLTPINDEYACPECGRHTPAN